MVVVDRKLVLVPVDLGMDGRYCRGMNLRGRGQK